MQAQPVQPYQSNRAARQRPLARDPQLSDIHNQSIQVPGTAARCFFTSSRTAFRPQRYRLKRSATRNEPLEVVTFVPKKPVFIAQILRIQSQ